MSDRKKFYDAKWEDNFFALDHSSPSFFHRKRMIKRLAGKKNLTGKILEVGCGDGSLLSLFRGDKNELYGCDISEKAIQLAKSKFGDDGYFAMGDLTNHSSLPTGEFDVIICSEVLEHIKNDELAIKSLYNKLKVGGHLIITVPHRKKYWSAIDVLDGHVRRYEKEELERKITKNGFIVCESLSWGYPLLHLYIFLKSINGKTVRSIERKSTKSKFKGILSTAFRLILYVDDFFMNTPNGKTLFLLAKKK